MQDSLPFPLESRTLEALGLEGISSVHVAVAGPPSGRPLCLWQGTSSPAPVMFEAFAPLVETYRVYCPDAPCQGEVAEGARRSALPMHVLPLYDVPLSLQAAEASVALSASVASAQWLWGALGLPLVAPLPLLDGPSGRDCSAR